MTETPTTLEQHVRQAGTWNLRDRALKGLDQGYLSKPVYDSIIVECDKIDTTVNHLADEKKRLETQLRTVIRYHEAEKNAR